VACLTIPVLRMEEQERKVGQETVDVRLGHLGRVPGPWKWAELYARPSGRFKEQTCPLGTGVSQRAEDLPTCRKSGVDICLLFVPAWAHRSPSCWRNQRLPRQANRTSDPLAMSSVSEARARRMARRRIVGLTGCASAASDATHGSPHMARPVLAAPLHSMS
jgi:hypothetical protein